MDAAPLRPSAPTLSAISPPSGLPGTLVDVELSGTNFVPLATTVEIVTTPRDPVVNVKVKDNTTITATIVIPAGSAPRTHGIVVITPGGVSERRQFVVRAPAAPPPVIGAFGVTPTSIPRGSGATLNWKEIFDATSCEIDHGVGPVPCHGGIKGVLPKEDTTYRLTAIGPGGYANATVGVRVAVAATVSPATPSPVTHGTHVFDFTGGTQTFIVPEGVTHVHVEAIGAQGGSGETLDGTEDGGDGGEIDGTLDVTPGEALTIVVGGEGQSPKHDNEAAAGGFNGGGDVVPSTHSGGGGGGASDVRQGGASMDDRVLVAGGGGGGGGGHESADSGKGGNGGGSGENGHNGIGHGVIGEGGQQATGSAGAPGQNEGGGGGGGWHGGGGGTGNVAADSGDGGGGGSSHASGTAKDVVEKPGSHKGNGEVVITF